ncbi:lysophospholipid acyltransferase family protein [Fimbriiglobus ruber]|uniref:Putative lipoprotein n=1 Tax=Fimbriiglobus ruber TaxID=1908690 RepID=A0A225D3X2_9BACT|nr:lysophospholipid acyltransferase family protein [Fimbriiglobus ruber]OWK36301.1 putative lipoprotein [Fimbriiglobus ruber]
MKIRNKRLIAAAGWLGSKTILGLLSTLRFELRHESKVVGPVDVLPPETRYIYLFWHENLLLPHIAFGHPSLSVLISKHADGQLLSSLIRAVGMGTVFGSTNRGGVEAVKGLVNGTSGTRHLVITPDGPRGPRRQVQAGVVYIASRTGMEIVPVGIGYDRPWRAGSWDRFAIPRPGSRARMVTAGSIAVPAGLRSAQLEPYRVMVQAEMDRLATVAERWAETNRYNAPEASEVKS